jgi:Cellulose binding domain
MARSLNRIGSLVAGTLLGGLLPACSSPEDVFDIPIFSATVSASSSPSLPVSAGASASALRSATAAAATSSAPAVVSASASASGLPGASASSPSATVSGSASVVPTVSASAPPTTTSTETIPSASATVSGTIPDIDGGDAGDAGDAGTPDGGELSDAETPAEDASLDASVTEDAGTDSATDSGAPPDAGAVVWTARVTCAWGNSATAATDRVQPVLTLTNLDAATLALGTVELRYYFSADSRPSVTSSLNYSPVNSTALSIVASPGVGADADHYLSVKFTGCTGGSCNLATNASAAIQTAIIAGPNGATFNALNDYSYDGGVTNPCDSVVVLKGSTVIFGTPPS